MKPFINYSGAPISIIKKNVHFKTLKLRYENSFIFLLTHALFAQNDSIFPNLSAHYRIEILTIDHITFEYKYNYEDLYIANNDPAEDTLSATHYRTGKYR